MKNAWPAKPLGEVCERVTVGHVGITEPFYRDKGITFLRTQNVGKQGLDLKDVKFITPEFHASLKKSEVRGGDILMSRVITHTVNCALVPSDLGAANCANVVLVRPGPAVVPDFLAHYIRSPAAQKHLLDRKVGSAQLVVNTTVVKEWPVPLPSRAEQERIVSLLDEAFVGISTARLSAEKNLRNARALFESHLDAVLTRRGPGWEEKPLSGLCMIARGGSPRPIDRFLTSESDGVNWIKIGDATASGKYIYKTAERIKPEGVPRSRLVHDGDFLLSNSMSFGRPYIMRTTGCIHDGWLVLSDYGKKLDQDYLYYVLGSRFMFQQFDRLAAGSTVRNLNIGLASRVQLPVPPLNEQKRIADQFEALSKETQLLAQICERKIAALDALKKSLLQAAFDGEL